MKSKVMAVIVAALCLISLCSCGGQEKANQEKSSAPDQSENTKAKETSRSEASFENEFITVELKEGWEVYDEELDKGLMRIRKKNDMSGMGPAIYFTFHGVIAGQSPCAASPKEDIAQFAEKYDGSEPEEVTYNNITYYRTDFDYGGPQAMMHTKIGDSCIHVKLAGRDALNNPDIKEMLNTVSYKTSGS